MARGRKPKNGGETVQQSMQIEFPNEAEFKKLCKKVKIAESTKNEGVSEMGGAISQAVEKHHIDKRAFGIFRRLDRLDDEKLAVCLAHLDRYREMGGLDERASRQAQLFAEAEIEQEGSEEPAPRRGKPDLRAVADTMEENTAA